MFEIELSLGFLLLGIVLDRWLWPRLIWPRLRAWITQRLIKKTMKKLSEGDFRVLNKMSPWPEHKPCPSCHSKTRHKADCPENPKNKVKA